MDLFLMIGLFIAGGLFGWLLSRISVDSLKSVIRTMKRKEANLIKENDLKHKEVRSLTKSNADLRDRINALTSEFENGYSKRPTSELNEVYKELDALKLRVEELENL